MLGNLACRRYVTVRFVQLTFLHALLRWVMHSLTSNIVSHSCQLVYNNSKRYAWYISIITDLLPFTPSKLQEKVREQCDRSMVNEQACGEYKINMSKTPYIGCASLR